MPLINCLFVILEFPLVYIGEQISGAFDAMISFICINLYGMIQPFANLACRVTDHDATYSDKNQPAYRVPLLCIFGIKLFINIK